MSERMPDPQGSVTVREFSQAPRLALDLEILQGHKGMDNEIRSPRIQKLGLTLAGFSGYIHPDRIQIFGGSELGYLCGLGGAEAREALERLRGLGICCILITKALDPPAGMLELARREEIPVLRCPAMSSVTIVRISDYLEERLAPCMEVHGVMMDIFGLGVLLLGPSGIGKSECALELVLKGHRLIADDAVEITRRGIERLVGTGGEVLRHHMELRGLGIIDVKELLGISATSLSQSLDLVIRLERWNPEADYDRLGLEQSTIEYLGAAVPLIEVPVAPGRNLAILVEVAARLHLLRQRGHKLSREVAAGTAGDGKEAL